MAKHASILKPDNSNMLYLHYFYIHEDTRSKRWHLEQLLIWKIDMEKLKSNLTGIVKEFSTVDEDIEMLDTAGVVLKFNENAPAESVEWICNLIRKPS